MFGKPILQNAHAYVQAVSLDLSLAFILFLFILSSSQLFVLSRDTLLFVFHIINICILNYILELF